MLLPHLASRLYGTPLLVARSKLEIILAVLGERVGWPEPQTAVPVPSPRTQPDAPPGIAVIPIYGTLVRRALGLEAASGLTSYGEIAATLEAALADPAVTGILLDVDSPGGEAGGVFELAEHIRAADAVKPVWAIASDSAFSAAYALACAASRLVVTRTGGVGSVGVIAMHVDQSVRDAQEGFRYTAITAGARKNDFSPHEQLSNEAAARLQAEVDRLYGIFVAHVAAMRGLDEDVVRATEAGLYFGPEAVAAGLADGEASLDTVLTEFSAYLAPRRSRGRSPPPNPRSLSLSTPHTQENLVMQTPESQPLPDPAEQPADAPATPTQEEAVQSAISATRADALAVAELCQLAGHPERTAAFLAEGASEAQVRRALLAARAESPEITSLIHPDAQAPEAHPDQNPLMKAVKKLTGKD
ncbi:MAG: S49 family peptidase [Pseudomonadales bacterium]|nr:S49 family peptidase [Pseudomonadales bacterium]